jgi:hypothetical protein
VRGSDVRRARLGDPRSAIFFPLLLVGVLGRISREAVMKLNVFGSGEPLMNRGQPVSLEEISPLPQRAAVAFAARCARRVQPLLKLPACSPDREQHTQAVAAAIAVAELVACGGPAENAPYYAEHAEATLGCVHSPTCASVVASAVHAASAAYAIQEAAPGTSDVHVARAAAEAAAAVGPAALDCLLGGMWRDFEMIRLAAEREGWMDDHPVPPEFFGPLWPEGEPPGWPAETPVPEDALILHIEIPDGVSEEELLEMVRQTVDRVDDLHRAYGGHGLRIESIQAQGVASAREGVYP